MSTDLSFREIFNIILKTTRRNSSYIANVYLLKDVSVISKWMSNKMKPNSCDILRITDFTDNESTDVQKIIICEQIRTLIINSSLDSSIKTALLSIPSYTDSNFNKFIREVISASTLTISFNNMNVLQPECNTSIQIDSNLIQSKNNVNNKSIRGRKENPILSGEFFRFIKNYLNISNYDMYSALEVNLNTISSWQTSKHPAKGKNLENIIDYFIKKAEILSDMRKNNLILYLKYFVDEYIDNPIKDEVLHIKDMGELINSILIYANDSDINKYVEKFKKITEVPAKALEKY